MNEDLVQFIWENGLFNQNALFCTAGQPIELVKKGRIQHGQGPDLNGGLVRINGQLWGGTIEVHKRASEWYEHGHHKDVRYENVILHVVLENDVSARTVSGRKPPTLELQHRINHSLLKEHERIMHTNAWVPCQENIHSVPKQEVSEWLNQLLNQRLQRKSQEAIDLLNAKGNDSSQTFYQILLRAFGLKVNADACSTLGEALPFSLLQKHRTNPLQLEALLFGAAGMLQTNFISSYPRRLQQEFAFLRKAHQLSIIPLASWHFGRIRPSNFPTIRLALFAALIQKLDGNLNALLSINSVKELQNMLSLSASEAWNERYTLDERSKTKVKTLGLGMRNTIITDAIVPFQFALGQYLKDETRINTAIHLLNEMHPASNRIVNEWQKLGIENKSMARSQALLELKNEYCNHRKCLNCSVGKLLMQKQVA